MGELCGVRIPPPRSCSAAEAATVARSPRDPRPLQRDSAALPAEERGPFAPAALGPWAPVTLAGPRDTAARALPRRHERGCCPRPRRAPREEQGRDPRGPLRPPCQRPRVAARAQPRGAEAGPGRRGRHGAPDSRGRRSCRRVLSVGLPVRGVARRTRDRPRWRKRRPPLAWLCARPCPLTGSRPPANPSRRVTAAAPAPAGGALRAQRSPPPPRGSSAGRRLGTGRGGRKVLGRMRRPGGGLRPGRGQLLFVARGSRLCTRCRRRPHPALSYWGLE